MSWTNGGSQSFLALSGPALESLTGTHEPDSLAAATLSSFPQPQWRERSTPIGRTKVISDPYVEDILKKRREALARISAIKLGILVWGPTPGAGTALAKTRNDLKEALKKLGHLVHFSEDLFDDTLPFSIGAQQIADVEAHDITFSMPDSPGSIAEAHSFFLFPGVAQKLMIFINEEHNAGYANSSIMELESTATSRISIYRPGDLPDCIVSKACNQVRRLQEIYYLLGRRW